MFNSISTNDDFMNSLMSGEEEIVESVSAGQYRNRYLEKSTKNKSPTTDMSSLTVSNKKSSSPKLDSTNRRYTMTPGGQPKLASDMVPIPSSRNMNYGRRLRYNLFGTSAPSNGMESNNSNMSSQPPIDSLAEQQISNSVATSVISRTNSLYSNNSTQVPYNPIEFQIERENLTLDTDQEVPRFKIGIFGRNSSIFTILFVLHLKSEWYYMDGKLKSTDSFRLDPTSDSFISTRPIINPIESTDENELTLVSLEWIDMSPTHNQHQLKDSEGFVFLMDVTCKDSSEESLSKNFEDQLRISTQYLQTYIKRRIMKNSKQDNFEEFDEPIVFMCYYDEDLYNLRDEELNNSSDKRNSIIMSNDDNPPLEESTRSVNIRKAIQKSLTENIPLKLKNTRIYVQEFNYHRALGSFIDNSFAFLATEITFAKYMSERKTNQSQNSISSFFASTGSSRDDEISDNLL